jgi:signal transduction histidine kinase
LLLLARFDRQTRELQLQSVSLVEMLHEALSHQQQDITTKSLRVQLDVQEEGWVQADPYLLGLVLDNLLNNAIKYSPPDSELHLWLERNEQGHLLLHLQDQGIGIREEDLADIFQPFFRSEALSHTHIRGQGLGLSIVQKICTLLQISPQVSSEAGKGTLFTLRFPQVSPAEPAISHLPGIMSP